MTQDQEAREVAIPNDASPKIRKKIGSSAVFGGIVLLLMALLPVYAGAYTVTTFIRIFYFGFLALSVRYLIGEGGMVSLTETAFFGLTGYMIGLLGYERGVPFPWADIIAMFSVVVLATMIGLIAVRTYKLTFLMITLAFGQILWAFARQNTSLLHGWAGIKGIRPFIVLGIDFGKQANFYWACLILFVIGLYVMWRLIHSPFGLALNGVRESPRRMAALGYPVFWIRLVAFLIAALYAGMGGVLLVYSTGIITPTVLQMSRTIWILLVVILGGVDYFWGPVVGTVVAVWLEVLVSSGSLGFSLASDTTGILARLNTLINAMNERYNTVIGVIFLLIVLFSPTGILGFFDKTRKNQRFTWIKKLFRQIG